MKHSWKLAIPLACGFTPFGAFLLAGVPSPPNLDLVNRLHEFVSDRFADPQPLGLGMSRAAVPSSLGVHYRPDITRQRDFEPARPAEWAVIRDLEQRHVQVGLYVFGASVVTSDPQQLDYRALKGPAAITRGTTRPSWYPPQRTRDDGRDALPDWQAIYPIARRAMKAFLDRGSGFETTLGTWNIAVRPLVASAQRCVNCHTNRNLPSGTGVRLGQPIGGVIYAFRQAPKDE